MVHVGEGIHPGVPDLELEAARLGCGGTGRFFGLERRHRGHRVRVEVDHRKRIAQRGRRARCGELQDPLAVFLRMHVHPLLGAACDVTAVARDPDLSRGEDAAAKPAHPGLRVERLPVDRLPVVHDRHRTHHERGPGLAVPARRPTRAGRSLDGDLLHGPPHIPGPRRVTHRERVAGQADFETPLRLHDALYRPATVGARGFLARTCGPFLGGYAAGTVTPMVSIGSTVGRYEIVAQLDSGGMADLFLGRRARDGRCFALKSPKTPKDPADPLRRMFLDEARIAAHIRHENVVQIEELVEVDGRPFLVMEYLPGLSLSGLLREVVKRQRRLTPVSAVAIGAQIAAGLHAAHETKDSGGQLLNVVHRDISPQNIILSANGDIKLIDFGIAKARDRLVKTRANQVKGKLRYMAPEQMRQQPMDRRTDIFALGIVLWEMLAMRRLFHRLGDAEVVRRIMAGEFSPPGKFAPVPHDVDQLVLRCLDPDPERRPATADALRAGLLAAVPGAAALERNEIASLVWAMHGSQLMHHIATLSVTAQDLGLSKPPMSADEIVPLRTEPMEQDAAVLALAEDDATEAGMSLPTDSSVAVLDRDKAPAAQVFAPPPKVLAPIAAPSVPAVDESPPLPRISHRPSPVPPPPSIQPAADLDDGYQPVRTMGRGVWVVLAVVILVGFALAAWAAAGFPGS